MTNTTTPVQRGIVPAAGPYRLDPSRSAVTFRTRHLFGLGAVSGTMAIAGGEITVDPAAPRATVTASLNADSFSTGNAGRDRYIRSAKFLHAGRYPHITFQAGTLSHAGGRWSLAGVLTVREVSHPVTLAVGSVQAAGNGFQARATARIDRYAFGITGLKGLAARHLDIDLAASAEPR